MPKLIRVLTYEGSEQFIANSITHSGVPMNGSHNGWKGQITSVIALAQSIPCSTCGLPTDNLTLICDKCTEHSRFLAANEPPNDRIL